MGEPVGRQSIARKESTADRTNPSYGLNVINLTTHFPGSKESQTDHRVMQPRRVWRIVNCDRWGATLASKPRALLRSGVHTAG